jgi:hypothetical protein
MNPFDRYYIPIYKRECIVSLLRIKPDWRENDLKRLKLKQLKAIYCKETDKKEKQNGTIY